jgi:hypothetical protein
MRKARLENWSVIAFGGPYTPPELMRIQLHGQVYDHDRFANGTEVTTSSLEAFDYGKRTALTQNTLYALGEPDPKFDAWLAEQGKAIHDYDFGAMPFKGGDSNR